MYIKMSNVLFIYQLLMTCEVVGKVTYVGILHVLLNIIDEQINNDYLIYCSDTQTSGAKTTFKYFVFYIFLQFNVGTTIYNLLNNYFKNVIKFVIQMTGY